MAERSSRKRTRSAKGLILDKMMNKNTPKGRDSDKRIKLGSKSDERAKVSRKIIFNDENKVRKIKTRSSLRSNVTCSTKGHNNNATMVKLTTKETDNTKKLVIKAHEKSKRIFDPHFHNVWSKEFGGMSSKNAKTNGLVSSVPQDSNVSNGINLVVDVDSQEEELDYVDDVIDEELSDLEVGKVELVCEELPEQTQPSTSQDKSNPTI